MPESYYAAIVGIDETYYTVSFNGVTGKVAKNSVSAIGYHEQAAGTAQTLHVSGKYSAFTGLKLRPTPESASEGEEPFVPTGEPFTYLGTYPTAENIWYYVCYGDKYGYILADFCDKEAEITPFVPEKKEEPIEETPPKEEEKEDGLVKILVVSGVAVTVLILLLVLILPRKGKKTRYYYET